MNLQLITEADSVGTVSDQHLSAEQMAELLAETSAPAQTHLLACESCAAEFDSLRDSLAAFRQATNAYVAQELRSIPHIDRESRLRFRPWVSISMLTSPAPAFLATAAALLMAAIIPLQMQR